MAGWHPRLNGHEFGSRCFATKHQHPTERIKLPVLYSWFPLAIYMETEKAMAPHSSTLAWKIPWTEEPVRLQSMESLRVGHD